MRSVGQLKKLNATYGNDVEFLFIYCREAHAADSDRPAGKSIEQPASTEERRRVAEAFLDDYGLKITALLDNIDDKTSKDYASIPDRMFLISKNGKIAFAGDRGPRGFRPEQLETAIIKELESTDAPTETPAPTTSTGATP